MHMDAYTFIVMLHVIGTILGTGGATVAELQIARALKDKRISMEERELMHANYGMIRAGMAIILVSVLGMFWYFQAQGSSVLFTSEKLWIKELMFVMIFVNAVLLHKRWVPLWLGASISFTSWWGATLLGLAGELPYRFTTYLAGYIIAIFAIAGLFHLLRLWRWMGYLNSRTIVISFVTIIFLVAVTVFYLVQGEMLRSTISESESVTVGEYRTLSETVSFDYPGGSHTITFDVAVDEAGFIHSISGADIDPQNQGRIADFVEAVNTALVGKRLSEVTPLSRIGGASLTTGAFNQALLSMQAPDQS
jgi:hypothetical protein